MCGVSAAARNRRRSTRCFDVVACSREKALLHEMPHGDACQEGDSQHRQEERPGPRSFPSEGYQRLNDREMKNVDAIRKVAPASEASEVQESAEEDDKNCQ